MELDVISKTEKRGEPRLVYGHLVCMHVLPDVPILGLLDYGKKTQ